MIKRLIAAFSAVLLIFSFACASAEVHPDEAPPGSWTDDAVLKVTFLEAGRSDAALLECGGEYMMIDAGRAMFGNAVVYDLKQKGITEFKYLLNTHPDDDHIDGYNYIIEDGSFQIDEFVSPFKEDARWNYQKRVVAKLKKANIPYRQLADGDILTLGGATLEVHVYPGLNYGINAHSAFIRVTYGSSTALFTGDVPGAVQEYFLDTLGADWLHADVLKFPHHGVNSMNKAFADAVSPAVAVITNRGKDAGKAAVNQMESRGITTLFSGDGEIDMVTDGTDWYYTQKEFLTSKRYLQDAQ